jgi:hypothetical protein
MLVGKRLVMVRSISAVKAPDISPEIEEVMKV